jgi:hypothetical protein
MIQKAARREAETVFYAVSAVFTCDMYGLNPT